MKILLSCSIILNIALLIIIANKNVNNTPMIETKTVVKTQTEQVYLSAPESNKSESKIEIIKKLGLSEEVYSSVIKLVIADSYKEKRKEIINRNKKHDWEWLAPAFMTDEQKTELALIDKEAEVAVRNLIGDEAFHAEAINKFREVPFFKNFSESKLLFLSELERDYNNLLSDAYAQKKNITEVMQLVNSEKDADLRANLTPEEYKAVSLYLSPYARSLSAAIRGEDVSENRFIEAYNVITTEKHPILQLNKLRQTVGDEAALKYAARSTNFGATITALSNSGVSNDKIVDIYSSFYKIYDANNKEVNVAQVFEEMTSSLTTEQKKAFVETPAIKNVSRMLTKIK